MLASARPPTSKLMASTNIVLPAPVSPVNAVRPPVRTISSFSITPKFSMRNSLSTIRHLVQILHARFGETSAAA